MHADLAKRLDELEHKTEGLEGEGAQQALSLSARNVVPMGVVEKQRSPLLTEASISGV